MTRNINGKLTSDGPSRRRGFTLIELLVVIMIIVLVTSAMIPVMSAASNGRRLREGARLVSTMLSSAQTRAISNGRSAGVLFQPMKNNPYASMEMYTIEVPPPYSGDDFGYTVKITTTTPPAGSGLPPNSIGIVIQGTVNPGPPVTYNAPTFGGLPVYDTNNNPPTPQKLIRNGDLIRFNYRGQLYVLTDIASTTLPPDYYITSNDPTTPNPPTLFATPTDPSASAPPKAAAVPFQIYRQPVKTSDPPVQLADGAAVDWYFSGIDLAPFQTGAGLPTPPPDHYPSDLTAIPYPGNPNMHSMFGALGTITSKSTAVPGQALLPSPSSVTGNTCGPVIVMFNSTGTLEQVYYSCTYPWYAVARSPLPINAAFNFQMRPVSGVYILVGKIEKIQQGSGPIQNDPNNLPNYQDPDCRWVTLTRQSGLVTTAEVAALQPAYTNSPAGSPPSFTTSPSDPYPQTVPEWAGVINAVMNSRRYASGNQSSGGI